MERVIYRNTIGGEIDFSEGTPFSLQHKSGFDSVDNISHSQAIYGMDGEMFISHRLSVRNLTLSGFLIGQSKEDYLKTRRRMISVFNPKTAGTIIYMNEVGEYHIDVIPEFLPRFNEDTLKDIARADGFTVTLKALDPYWKSPTATNEQLVTYSGGLTFPLRLPTIFGNHDSDAKSRIIVNEGDSPTPIEVTFEGPATSPIRIENETTGDFIEVAQDLLEGEKLWICTEFGRKRVEKILADGTRKNAFHYIYIDPTGINPSSTFFELQPGNNLLTYNTGAEYEKAPVSVKFKNRYVGI